MRNRSLTLLEIALECGFASHAHLSYAVVIPLPVEVDIPGAFCSLIGRNPILQPVEIFLYQ
jgi:AraC-like DNA-binding protein